MTEKPRHENKYAKIQPAVAIKPKPQGSSPSKVSFDPKYDPLKSVSTIICDDQSNINMSRQWVLPPRPRPGRKPTTKEGVPASGVGASKVGVVGPKPVAMPPKKEGSPPAVSGEASSTPVHPEVTQLQKMLLARLKEQELVQNYIEVLTNQIHELKLAQSGVITFDALSSEAVPKRQVPTSPDHLDHIHNVRDLDKFLAHLTTQAKVIHSVTKKYVSKNADVNLQQQIKHQLQLKKEYDTARSHVARPAPSSNPASSETKISKPFMPSLLRPMNLNVLENEDEVIDVDIIKDSDMFERVKEEDNFGDFKPRKRGCGFCIGDGPCLCFDADSLFGERQV